MTTDTEAAPPRGRAAADNPRRELVREQLIDQAAALFLERGYGATSLNDIAAALGLGRSSIYYYFRNKEEIVEALVREQSLRPYDALTRIQQEAGLSPREKLRRAVTEGIVRRLTGGPRFLVIGRLEAYLAPELEVLLNRSKRHVLDIYAGFIAAGIEAGEFRRIDPVIAAFAVIGMANWTAWWYSPSGKRTPAEIADIIVDIALRGLQAADGAEAAPADLEAAIRRLKEDVAALERLAR